ncbi:DUF4352 domain-containing protein [Lactobacillus delbrueckii subsp. bulgaricus]|uniref:DUF4352 domain-containing protein n=1 Tax=Lactobacillus delbrueckii TaxID=1584 RepID=UPI000E749FD1|nr:DUF4352 domain-containing protein [Lactobacillus delbrueckii]AYC66735.1 DUF4352 domain-containing protein [Lactobacillus delbrueckii subsp. bulgaricus]MBT9089351.1 DUF4352 domain-containing protein [Lactobacillus delbrueckii subsp. bulgaricus]MBT9090964.1 DUF4352 domain-containing protein [Lactobacillus delbrueckii subsp. bulgaricus]MBT9092588.1 DUF4352 domain-containing protein [Lactobacillus delbrueckii subsp. bulgaricus]MBT9094284.1 DUF4352 domain-containing protein [Lactobacillus delbru
MAKQIKDENGNVYVQKKKFYKRWWFWLLVVLVVVFLGSGAFGGSSDSDSSSDSAAKSQTSSKKKAEANPLSKVYSVGQKASYKGYEIKVNSVKFSQGSEYNRPDSGKQFVIINLTITNHTDESQDYNPFDFKLNADGNNTDLDAIDTDVDNTLDAGSLDKGASVSGNLVGEAKTSAKTLQLQYKTSIWNDNTVKFKLK